MVPRRPVWVSWPCGLSENVAVMGGGYVEPWCGDLAIAGDVGPPAPLYPAELGVE